MTESELKDWVWDRCQRMFGHLRYARREYITFALRHPDRERALYGEVEAARRMVECAIEEAVAEGAAESRDAAYRKLHAEVRL